METSKTFDSVFCDVIQGGNADIIHLVPRFKFDCLLYKNEKAFKVNDPMDHWFSSNLVTNQGKNALNDIMFHSATQITAWYVIIFGTDTTPTTAMTYAVPVYTEFAAYATARPAYAPAVSSSQVISNLATRATFTMNGGGDIYGTGLVGGGSAASTKSDTAGGGTLYCASKFGSYKTVIATNILSVGVSITQS